MPDGKGLARRMSISVPASLQEQMKRVKNVNWSGIAQDAFRAHIARGSVNSTVRELRAENAQLRAFLNKLIATTRNAAERFGLTGAGETT